METIMFERNVHSAAIFATVLIGLAGTPAAHAHNIWATTVRDGGRLTAQIMYADVEKPELADRSRVVTASVVSASGRNELRKGLKAGSSRGAPSLQTGPFDAPRDAVLELVYDNGFWVDLPDKSEVNTNMALLPDGAARRWTVKFGKTLLGPGAFHRETKHRLEMVPLKDPYAMGVGDMLPVRLQLDGKPYAGAAIAYSDGVEPIPDAKMPTAKTGADGVAMIPFTRKGAYLFTVDLNAAPTYPALTVQDHVYASLGFDTSQ
jgi:uncharacterized GH25 family protein